MASISPNRYTLTSADGKTKVEYDTQTFVGTPAFNLTEAPGPIRHFAGSQIRTISTEIGTLISVTTMLTIDTGATSFSVLLPAITLANATTPVNFSTDAIVTRHSGPNSFPINGVHESYTFIPMTGHASFVFTLLEPIAAGLAQAAKK